MSIHGAPIPCSAAKASLLLVCAHPWEARPFLERGWKPCSRPHLPFDLFEGQEGEVSVRLVLSGPGPSSALMATACLLSQELAAHGLATGGGATAPPWLVANFGTAGGAAKDWELGQSALVVRLRDDRQGQAIYPERLLRWEGAEAECCTVAQPQRTLPEETSDQTGRGLLFDMEAHAVASATLRFLSTAHLLVGKCVSDHLGEAERSWKELAERCQADYWRASQRFLEHALSHALALWRDPRRRRGEAIAAQSRELLQATLQVLPLTVSQQRELHQHLKARLAACPDAAAYQEAAASYRARLLTAPTPGKSGSKQALTRLLEELRPSL